MAKETSRKLSVNWTNSEDIQDRVNLIKKTQIKNNPTNVIKKNAEIILADRELIPLFDGSNTSVFSHIFENLPEWTIPHFRIKYFIESEDGLGFPLEEASFSSTVHETWVQSGVNYIFSLILRVTAFNINSEALPAYLTASLIFDNPRIFNELQFNKA